MTNTRDSAAATGLPSVTRRALLGAATVSPFAALPAAAAQPAEELCPRACAELMVDYLAARFPNCQIDYLHIVYRVAGPGFAVTGFHGTNDGTAFFDQLKKGSQWENVS